MLPCIGQRFGTEAALKGFVTLEQVVEALRIRIKQEVEKGKIEIIGQILIRLGYMTKEQVNEVLDSMEESLGFCYTNSKSHDLFSTR